jgi:hypothetical protein
MTMPKWLRRLIVRAAPTCTLWVDGPLNWDVLQFRFNRRWVITWTEIEDSK